MKGKKAKNEGGDIKFPRPLGRKGGIKENYKKDTYAHGGHEMSPRCKEGTNSVWNKG